MTARRSAFILLNALALIFAVPAQADNDTARGAVLVAAAGCTNCHTDITHHGAALAGGRALRTSFGTFYTPNISPDPVFGIGKWTAGDFRRALREGIGPDGQPYYPAFPYTSYTNLSDQDISAIRDYLQAQPAQSVASRPHDLRSPYDFRRGLWLWRAIYFHEGPWQPDPDRSAEWNQGAYLARAVAHCGECHTPRNWLGASQEDRRYAGGSGIAYGMSAPDITPDPAALGKWSIDDIVSFLGDGMMPSGDFAGGAMAEVVRGTARLSTANRHSLAVYLKAQTPIPPPESPVP